MDMSEERIRALSLALKAVLSVAKKQGVHLDDLTEAAAEELEGYRDYDVVYVPEAINEIEVAVDAIE
jgi:hypothetical protein